MAKKNYKLTDKDFAKMKKVHAKANKYTDNSFHFYLSFNLRIVFLVLIALILCILSFNLYKNSFSEPTSVIAKYKETGSVDNNVTRFENELLDTGNLVLGDVYMSDLVNDIGLDFNYSIDFNKDVKYSYTYSVVGKMSLFNNEKEVSIYQDYNLLKDISNSATGDKLIIKQNVNLDYDYYNNLAKEFNVNGDLTGNFHLVMDIKVKVLDSSFDHENEIDRTIEVDIPILSSDVKVTADNFDEEKSFMETTDSKLVNPTSLFGAVLLIIIDTVLILSSISYINSLLPKKSKYCYLRDGLLQDYDKIIVNSRKINKFTNYNIIDCYSFQELMDAQRLLEKPIIYHEIVKNQKCIFYIIDGNDCYQYILKECDIDY